MMRAPSLQSVDAQFDALFAGRVLPRDIAPPAARDHQFNADGQCLHCGCESVAPDARSTPCV